MVQQRAGGADATAADQVDLDARFVQRPKNAGMVRARRARPGQQQRRAEPSRVGRSGAPWVITRGCADPRREE